MADVLYENNYNKYMNSNFLKSITKQNDIKMPVTSKSVKINRKGQVFVKQGISKKK